MPSKNHAQRLLLFLKGMAMGAADVVPGVSGGTIALISGIYQELVSTIHNLNFSFFARWRNQGFLSAWKHHNLGFLLTLFAGVGVSLFALAKAIGWLLQNEPIAVWSFFFGLIVASVVYVGRMIQPWNAATILVLLLAAGLSYYITLAAPTTAPQGVWFLFLAGFIAIIAMILPGLSGSFILLLMGAYTVFLETLNNFREGLAAGDWQRFGEATLRLISFGLGAVLGLKVFSGVLNWLFKNHKNLTLAILTGFMLGALNKVWPWKKILTWRTDSKGETVPLLERSIFPVGYEGDPQLGSAITLAVCGFLLIFVLEGLAKRMGRSPE